MTIGTRLITAVGILVFKCAADADSKLEFERIRASSGHNSAVEYRSRFIAGGVVWTTFKGWEHDGNGYQLIEEPSKTNRHMLDPIRIYTDKTNETIYPDLIIRSPTPRRYQSLADFYLHSGNEHLYTQYISYQTNIVGLDCNAFERSAEPGASIETARELIIFDQKGFIRQVHSYSSSNTVINSILNDNFSTETRNLLGRPLPKVPIKQVASEWEEHVAIGKHIKSYAESKIGSKARSLLMTICVTTVVTFALMYVIRERQAAKIGMLPPHLDGSKTTLDKS